MADSRERAWTRRGRRFNIRAMIRSFVRDFGDGKAVCCCTTRACEGGASPPVRSPRAGGLSRPRCTPRPAPCRAGPAVREPCPPTPPRQAFAPDTTSRRVPAPCTPARRYSPLTRTNRAPVGCAVRGFRTPDTHDQGDFPLGTRACLRLVASARQAGVSPPAGRTAARPLQRDP
jgi:hypothetical protein